MSSSKNRPSSSSSSFTIPNLLPVSSSTSTKTPLTKRARKTIPLDEMTPIPSNLLPSSSKLNLVQAEVFYVPEFVEDTIAKGWFEGLIDLEGWYQPTLKMYGKEITQSRKIAAYATDPNLTVKYSGQIVKMRYDYPPLLREIQDLVEERLGIKFNHCMLNNYENGSVYIGPHRDNKENRVIASLSLGAARTFIMKHTSPPTTSTPVNGSNDDAGLYEKKWILENGSLVVMQGETQQFWKHEIPKEQKIKEGRISLTFRQLVF